MKVLILTGYGINCDYETYHAFKTVGAKPEYVHVNDLIEKKKKLSDYRILVFPGGFSFGDDIASGKVLANKFRYRLKDDLDRFIEDGNLILGICNGFQMMVKLGILPDHKLGQQTTLTFNDSGKFEDRWVYLKVNPDSPCVFTKGMDCIYLPVRHGEGKFIADKQVIGGIMDDNLYALQYVDEDGNAAGYPCNPNGSVNDIAGVCDKTGRIFGLMPHPEGHFHYTHHPRWTRMKRADRSDTGNTDPRNKMDPEVDPEAGDGYQIFRNAVEFVKNGR